jgi:hypothetical protein
MVEPDERVRSKDTRQALRHDGPGRTSRLTPSVPQGAEGAEATAGPMRRSGSSGRKSIYDLQTAQRHGRR